MDITSTRQLSPAGFAAVCLLAPSRGMQGHANRPASHRAYGPGPSFIITCFITCIHGHELPIILVSAAVVHAAAIAAMQRWVTLGTSGGWQLQLHAAAAAGIGQLHGGAAGLLTVGMPACGRHRWAVGCNHVAAARGAATLQPAALLHACLAKRTCTNQLPTAMMPMMHSPQPLG